MSVIGTLKIHCIYLIVLILSVSEFVQLEATLASNNENSDGIKRNIYSKLFSLFSV